MKDSIKATKKKPQFVKINLDTSKSDVGDIAKAIGGTSTPHSNIVAPATAVVVPKAGVTKKDTKKVQKALANVKGVDVKHSKAGKGEVIVQLDKHGGARLAEIQKALK